MLYRRSSFIHYTVKVQTLKFYPTGTKFFLLMWWKLLGWRWEGILLWRIQNFSASQLIQRLSSCLIYYWPHPSLEILLSFRLFLSISLPKWPLPRSVLFLYSFFHSAHGSQIPLPCQSVFNAMLSFFDSTSYYLIQEKVPLNPIMEVDPLGKLSLLWTFLGICFWSKYRA